MLRQPHIKVIVPDMNLVTVRYSGTVNWDGFLYEQIERQLSHAIQTSNLKVVCVVENMQVHDDNKTN